MKLNIRSFLVCWTISATATSSAMVPYVNPQPGENLWGLVSREGLALDYLLDLDFSTTTVDAIYALTKNIDTIVDGCCVCDHFIGQADIPMTITTPGVYCLIEDISATTTAITIIGTDIVLDLQEHRISASNGSAISTTGNRITVKNGSVVAPNGVGVLVGNNGVSSNTIINNVFALQCNTGFYSTPFAVDILYTHCEARSNFVYGFFSALSASNHKYTCCTAVGNISDGFHLAGLGNLVPLFVSDCVSSDNGGAGFLLTSLNGFSIFRCTALKNSHSGFAIIVVNGIIYQCYAVNNGSEANDVNGNGFYLEPTTSGISVIGCTSTSNAYRGFSSPSSFNRFFNNFAIRNSNAGGNYAINPATGVVKTTPDLIANNNLSWWINMDGEFLY